MNLELGAGLKLDSSIIPGALRYLVPTIERFGFSSQELQDEFVTKMQKNFPQQLAEFNRKIDDAREKIIDWGKELVELNKHKDEIDETTWHHPYWSFLDALKLREISEPPNSPLENDVITNAAAEARSNRFSKVSEKASASFRNEDYRTFVELLIPFADQLSAVQKRKLEFAQKQLETF